MEESKLMNLQLDLIEDKVEFFEAESLKNIRRKHRSKNRN